MQYEDQVPNVSPDHFSFPSSQFIGHAYSSVSSNKNYRVHKSLQKLTRWALYV